jgi:FkbH-like protein
MDVRRLIDGFLAEGDFKSAEARLRALWREEKTSATAAFVTSRAETIQAHAPRPSIRIAILRSFTLEPVLPFVHAEAFAAGLDAQVWLGDFNAYAQEILSPDSNLYRGQPDVVILAVQTRDLSPLLWTGFSDAAPADIEAEQDRIVSNYRGWIRTLRAHSQASVVIHNLECPAWPLNGVFDQQAAVSQAAAIGAIDTALRESARQERGVYVLDYDGLVSRVGRERWFDERKWLTVRLPINSACLIDLVQEWFRFLHPLTGKVAKAVVFDLDNTIWGGVIGEEGLNGIKLGREYPGAAFRDFQQALIDLKRRGILLAVCSKNNPEDAFDVFDHHPEMLITREMVAAWRLNWASKAQNLREIAAELNIGIDALAFVDDNPVEREHVRAELPEVAVLDLPAQPLDYARALRRSPWFERLSRSEEDRQRSEMYAAQRQRSELAQSAASREEFFRSLEQVAEISPVSAATLTRVSQLTQKTNQFNLTTTRYSEQQIETFMRQPGWTVYAVRVSDRFADNGLVGVAITETRDHTLHIDTFLLSCRVISRCIETALLSYIVEQARNCGARRVRGWFRPTRKNAPCREFYPAHGFTAVEQDGDAVLWELDLGSGKTVECPADFVRLVVPQPQTA